MLEYTVLGKTSRLVKLLGHPPSSGQTHGQRARQAEEYQDSTGRLQEICQDWTAPPPPRFSAKGFMGGGRVT